jgi:hypothetical protein
MAAGFVTIEFRASLAFALLNPSSGNTLLNSDLRTWFTERPGQYDEGLYRKVIQQKTGVSLFESLTVISTASASTRNQLPGQTSPCLL